MGIASLPEIQDVENLPSYAEWLIDPAFGMLRLRPDAVMVLHTQAHTDRFGLPLNPDATLLVRKLWPASSSDVYGNALVAGLIYNSELTDCPVDILRLLELDSPD
jgi:hypothetical protein